MTKLVLFIVMGAMLVFAGCGNGEEVAGFEDGTFEGTAEGYGGPVTVEVMVEGGEISAIDVVEEDETDDFAGSVFDQLPDEIIENQGTEGVDTVTDATKTSEAVLNAVDEALAEAE